jgi:hypothetical protein
MITSNIMGGLGNQLFQIFTTISYAIDNNCEFIFPNTKNLYAGENTTLRYSYWDLFLQNLQPFLKDEKDIIYNVKIIENYDSTYTRIPSIVEMINDINSNNNTNNENECKIFNENDINIYLTGYFQSEKYFAHNYNQIVNLINLNQYKNKLLEYIASYNDLNLFLGNSISLHFRMGDFAKYTDYYVILSDYYYIKSIETIVKNDQSHDQYNIIYFCENEDIIEVEKRIENIQNELSKKNINNCVFIKCPSMLSDWQEMLFMSMCKHNIVANSTFSWWGAYFNENVNKIVCYPTIYYAKDVNKNTKDLFPEKWIKIE